MRRIDSGDHLRHNHRQASQRRVSVIVTNGIISILAAVSSGLGEDFFGPVSSPEWRKEKLASAHERGILDSGSGPFVAAKAANALVGIKSTMPKIKRLRRLTTLIVDSSRKLLTDRAKCALYFTSIFSKEALEMVVNTYPRHPISGAQTSDSGRRNTRPIQPSPSPSPPPPQPPQPSNA